MARHMQQSTRGQPLEAILRQFLLLIAVPYHSVTYVLKARWTLREKASSSAIRMVPCRPAPCLLGLLYERCLVPYDDAFTWTLLSDLVASAHVHCEVNLC